jgi:hypothetical protein
MEHRHAQLAGSFRLLPNRVDLLEELLLRAAEQDDIQLRDQVHGDARR